MFSVWCEQAETEMQFHAKKSNKIEQHQLTCSLLIEKTGSEREHLTEKFHKNQIEYFKTTTSCFIYSSSTSCIIENSVKER